MSGFILDRDLINEACDMLDNQRDRAMMDGDNSEVTCYSIIRHTLKTMSDEYFRMKEEYNSLCEGIRQNAIIFTEEEREIIKFLRRQYEEK